MNESIQIASGVLLGDFLVAALHWFEDTYLPYTEDDGPLAEIARDNEMHHFLPYTITAMTPLENVSVTLPLTIAFLTFIYISFPKWFLAHLPFLLSLGTVAVLSNLIHRYTHERLCRRPLIIKKLQDFGILISTPEHADHHMYPHKNYGVVLGFTNQIYDTIGLWRGLEKIIPLKRYPKPGVDAYKTVYDEWTKENMGTDCPERLTSAHMKTYHGILRDFHSNSVSVSTNNKYPSNSA